MTKEIEHLVIPDEVLQNPLAYTRLPESSDRISRRLEYVSGHFELHIYRIPSFVKNGKRSKAGLDAPIYAAAPQGILPGSNMGASIIALALHIKYLHLSPLSPDKGARTHRAARRERRSALQPGESRRKCAGPRLKNTA